MAMLLMGCRVSPAVVADPVVGAPIDSSDSSDSSTVVDPVLGDPLNTSTPTILPVEDNPVELPQPVDMPFESIPQSVLDAVFADLSAQTGLPVTDLYLVTYMAETWPDGCLGLGGIAELCMAALVDGWHLQVGNGDRTWFYRSDATGQTVRMVDDHRILPPSVENRIVTYVAEQSAIAPERIQVVDVSPQTWDGCMGVAPEGTPCTQIAIFGWRVEVLADGESQVYHTDQGAYDIRLKP